jgi:hypothetical protein
MWNCCVRYGAVTRAWAWQLPVHRPAAVASVAASPRPSQLIDLVYSATPGNGADAAPTCIFCDNPGGTVEYAWPEWLCRFLTEWSDGWNEQRGFDVAVIERLRCEVGLEIDGVCAGCSRGWMQRLDDKVSPFLKSMIAGDPTPLSPARQTLLARWAAKTAAVMERGCDSPIRTPRFGCEHVRRVGVHPGTQVLIGRYDGDLQVFTHERDLFTRTINGARHYLSQSTFVMGHVLIQVFADPYRNSVPELADDAGDQLFALVPARDQTLNWPPEFSIDDADYDLVRHGPSSAPPDVDADTADDADDVDEAEPPDDVFAEVGAECRHRDFGVASVDLLAGDADEGLARARWKDQLGRYVQQQGPLDALRLRPSSEKPWPASDNPMVGFLIERCTEIATEDGIAAAARWLAANAWLEGVIAERARIERFLGEA